VSSLKGTPSTAVPSAPVQPHNSPTTQMAMLVNHRTLEFWYGQGIRSPTVVLVHERPIEDRGHDLGVHDPSWLHLEDVAR
jgi:hypothetical protein